jgi:hypothetical protein
MAKSGAAAEATTRIGPRMAHSESWEAELVETEDRPRGSCVEVCTDDNLTLPSHHHRRGDQRRKAYSA